MGRREVVVALLIAVQLVVAGVGARTIEEDRSGSSGPTSASASDSVVPLGESDVTSTTATPSGPASTSAAPGPAPGTGAAGVRREPLPPPERASGQAPAPGGGPGGAPGSATPTFDPRPRQRELIAEGTLANGTTWRVGGEWENGKGCVDLSERRSDGKRSGGGGCYSMPMQGGASYGGGADHYALNGSVTAEAASVVLVTATGERRALELGRMPGNEAARAYWGFLSCGTDGKHVVALRADGSEVARHAGHGDPCARFADLS